MFNEITRRSFLGTCLTSAAACAVGGCGGQEERTDSKRRPNILFILIDDLGKEWVSCYGAEGIETPNFDRLAAGGIRFTNAYSMAQCTPSRVTLLTGQYPWRTGWINHWDVPRWGAGCHFDWRHYTTFARILRDSGYATAAAGKWQVSDFRIQPDAMDRHGFDEWCMWTGFETGNPPSAERYWNPYINTREGSKTFDGRFGADVFVDFLEDFMGRHRDDPMMLYFPMCLTHTPFTDTPLERGVTDRMDCHRAMVRYADHAVGRLLDTLDRLGIRDDTIVFLTTDNGTARSVTGRLNGREVRGGKASIAENGICEPFIISCPGRVPEGLVTDALTDFTDMLPTFVDLAGAELPPGTITDGISIADFILGQADDIPRDWIMSMGFGSALLTERGVEPVLPFNDRAVRDKRFKLWIENGAPTRFHDLTRDPAELSNHLTSADPQHTEAREKLLAVVRSFPKEDARPKYDPTPPQAWDVKPDDDIPGRRN